MKIDPVAARRKLISRIGWKLVDDRNIQVQKLYINTRLFIEIFFVVFFILILLLHDVSRRAARRWGTRRRPVACATSLLAPPMRTATSTAPASATLAPAPAPPATLVSFTLVQLRVDCLSRRAVEPCEIARACARVGSLCIPACAPRSRTVKASCACNQRHSRLH